MYIYLDETFNLKKGTKNQFLAIAGYSTQKPKELAKIFLRIKKSKLPKKLIGREIKGVNVLAEKLIKPHLFREILNSDILIYCNFQNKKLLSRKYFIKNKLNYNNFYLDLLTDLLIKRINYQDSKIIILTLDTFKTKRIDKRDIISGLKEKLKEKYSDKNFEISFENSADFVNLQLADFICSVFHDAMFDKEKWLNFLKPKIARLTKNSLK